MKKNSFQSDCIRIDFTFKHQYFILLSDFFGWYFCSFYIYIQSHFIEFHFPHLFHYSTYISRLYDTKAVRFYIAQRLLLLLCSHYFMSGLINIDRHMNTSALRLCILKVIIYTVYAHA